MPDPQSASGCCAHGLRRQHPMRDSPENPDAPATRRPVHRDTGVDPNTVPTGDAFGDRPVADGETSVHSVSVDAFTIDLPALTKDRGTFPDGKPFQGTAGSPPPNDLRHLRDGREYVGVV